MFAFSQVEPRTNGSVSDMEVPVSRYLHSAFEQGEDDSIYNSIYKMRELSLEQSDPTSKVLSPEEANNKYSLPGLKWDQPVKENVAQTLNRRQQAELDRQFFMSQDNHSVVTGLAGMGAGMAGSLMNPLDLATLFLPVVGEEAKLVNGANVLGRGALLRATLRGGMVTRSALQELAPAAPRLVESVLQGVGYQAVQEGFQISNRITEGKGGANIDDLKSLGFGALMAGGIHLGMSAAARILRSMSPVVREATARKAMDDFVSGRQIDVDPIIKTQEPQTMPPAAHSADIPDDVKGWADAEGLTIKSGQYGAMKLDGMPPELVEQLKKTVPEQWEVTDRDPNSKSAGYTTYVPAGSKLEDIRAHVEQKRQDYIDALDEKQQQVVEDARKQTSTTDPKLQKENKTLAQNGHVSTPEQVKENTLPATPQDPDVTRVAKEAKDLHEQVAQDPRMVRALEETGFSKEELDSVWAELGMETGEEKKPKVKKTKPTPTSEPAKTASVPVMVTKKMESDLKEFGFSQEEINKMRPEDAHKALEEERLRVQSEEEDRRRQENEELAQLAEERAKALQQPKKDWFNPVAVANKNLETGEITPGKPGQIHAQLLGNTKEKLIDQQARISRITQKTNEAYTEAYDLLEKFGHEDPDAAIAEMEKNSDPILERYENKDEEDVSSLAGAVEDFKKQKKLLEEARGAEEDLKTNKNVEPGFVDAQGNYMSKKDYQAQINEATAPYRQGPVTDSIKAAADCLVQKVV